MDNTTKEKLKPIVDRWQVINPQDIQAIVEGKFYAADHPAMVCVCYAAHDLLLLWDTVLDRARDLGSYNSLYKELQPINWRITQASAQSWQWQDWNGYICIESDYGEYRKTIWRLGEGFFYSEDRNLITNAYRDINALVAKITELSEGWVA